jgi:hypothetical protein
MKFVQDMLHRDAFETLNIEMQRLRGQLGEKDRIIEQLSTKKSTFFKRNLSANAQGSAPYHSRCQSIGEFGNLLDTMNDDSVKTERFPKQDESRIEIIEDTLRTPFTHHQE